MPSNNDRLDEILKELCQTALTFGGGGNVTKEIAQARQQIIEWALECVGPDDDHTYMERKDRATAPVRTRNQLRHEIIAKLRGAA